MKQLSLLDLQDNVILNIFILSLLDVKNNYNLKKRIYQEYYFLDLIYKYTTFSTNFQIYYHKLSKYDLHLFIILLLIFPIIHTISSSLWPLLFSPLLSISLSPLFTRDIAATVTRRRKEQIRIVSLRHHRSSPSEPSGQPPSCSTSLSLRPHLEQHRHSPPNSAQLRRF